MKGAVFNAHLQVRLDYCLGRKAWDKLLQSTSGCFVSPRWSKWWGLSLVKLVNVGQKSCSSIHASDGSVCHMNYPKTHEHFTICLILWFLIQLVDPVLYCILPSILPNTCAQENCEWEMSDFHSSDTTGLLWHPGNYNIKFELIPKLDTIFMAFIV